MIQHESLMDEKQYKQISQKIKEGEIVIFPTETVYGIGTNGLDENAVKKLYEVKQRPLEKPISLLVSNMEMIELIAKDITQIEYKIMHHFFPGPLTIILKKNDIVPDIVTAGKDTVGIRMPNGDCIQNILKYANIPIATPSANISGKPSGINFQEVKHDFEENVNYFIDGGKSKIGLSSTIVQVIDGNVHILRQGSITKKQILKVIKE